MKEKTPVIAVPTEEISRIVQEKLFELGYKWVGGSKEHFDGPTKNYSKKAYICIDKLFSYGNRKWYLEDHKDDYYEISMYDLYQMGLEKADTVKLFNEKGELVVELSRQSLENLKKL